MEEKVVVITTGGTIAMRYDPTRQGMVPAISGQELVEDIPFLSTVCPVEIMEFSNIPSAQMTPQIMRQIADLAEATLARAGVAGIVITHGTDTLEETAYFLDLFTAENKPICLTAAMRTSAEASSDGPGNILSAVRVAASENVRGYGVLAVVNNEIHAACDVMKTHAASVGAFCSPFWGPLGYVDTDSIIMRRAPLKRQHIRPSTMAEHVPILKLYTGMDDRIFRHLASDNIDGLVIEGFGRGNIPASAVPGVQLLLEKNTPVVVTSRVQGGRVLGVYAAEGGAAHLNGLGAILGGEISSQKARLKLMLSLGVTREPKILQSMFA